MVSEKVRMILQAQTDMLPAEIDTLKTDGEGWKIIRSAREKRKDARKDERPEICFTGFAPSKKDDLAAQAQGNGFKVVKSVTKNLRFLCTGDNPGPAKVQDATKKGARLLTETEFLDLIRAASPPAQM